MTTIRLTTAKGDLVHEAQIPPFQPMPEILIWGIRTFQQKLRHAEPVIDGETHVYQEAFATHVIDHEPGKLGGLADAPTLNAPADQVEQSSAIFSQTLMRLFGVDGRLPSRWLSIAQTHIDSARLFALEHIRDAA